MSSIKPEDVVVEDEDENEEIPDSEKTPVTLITGFLGSGKTTLVNYILKEQSTWKICVVENEFGEVAIDGDLVEENLAAKEDIITMDNGCVCCSVRGDLVRTFGMLVARRKDFDAIIIETTGLADPAPIVFTFNTNAIIQDNFRIDSVVCLVDAKHINIHLDDIKPEGSINEAEHQIAFSDRILLNKTDLVDEEELQDVQDRIKAMNSFATIIKTHRSRVPLDQILGLNTFSLDKMVELFPDFMDSENEEEEVTGHIHDEHCNHGHDDHGGCTEDHDHTGHEHSSHKHDNAHMHDDHCNHGCTEDHDHKDHDHKDHDHKDHDHKDHDHSSHKHDDHTHDHGHEHGHEHGHDHTHNEPVAKKLKKVKKVHNLSLVSSVGFSITGPLDVIAFNTFMGKLLAEKAADLYRTKGVLAFSNQGDTKFVFQGVHEQINFGPTDKPWIEEEKDRVSKMVFIGKNLDYNFLQQSLKESCTFPDVAIVKMHKRV